jgi:hypothetical protein
VTRGSRDGSCVWGIEAKPRSPGYGAGFKCNQQQSQRLRSCGSQFRFNLRLYSHSCVIGQRNNREQRIMLKFFPVPQQLILLVRDIYLLQLYLHLDA